MTPEGRRRVVGLGRPTGAVALIGAALLTVAPDPQRLLAVAEALRQWVPLAALSIALASALCVSRTGLRAAPLLGVAALLVGGLLLPRSELDPTDVVNFLGTTALLVGILVAANRTGTRMRVVLAVRRFVTGRDRFDEQQLFVVMGHAELDVRQAAAPDGHAVFTLTVVAGTVLLRLPAEWRLVIRHSSVGLILTEHGVPRDIDGAPIVEFVARGMLGRVEVSRL